ncbi:MAG: Asp-tRNA(Asn)/Glu-tRNA(Gln) amidotransferase subunit GatA, partial [Hellea sp.]|nr:Asp-tRNA(Asn)/Glu-tRNA(Gln) amidotransferase subunit GatA [Hellea sp.]
MTDLTKYTLDEALKGMKRGDFTSVELTQAHINACENATELNAFVTTSFEQALEAAKNSDLRRAKGEI